VETRRLPGIPLPDAWIARGATTAGTRSDGDMMTQRALTRSERRTVLPRRAAAPQAFARLHLRNFGLWRNAHA
jgi:hypothetical protein